MRLQSLGMAMRLAIAGLVFVATINSSLIANGQLPSDSEERTPKDDDLLAYIESEDGKPISGVEAKLDIKRTVGFFSGSGTPPISSRIPSSPSGELRFSNGTNWRDWIAAELAAKSKDGREARDLTEAIAEFKAYQWTVNGYWPRTNSRIDFVASGRPALWDDTKPVKLILPSLHQTRVRVTSVTDRTPLANVRLWITQFGIRTGDELWDSVSGFAWTDATGSAVLWLPNGSYDVRWDKTLCIVGANARSDLFDIRTAEFAEPKRLLPLNNGTPDGDRVIAFKRKTFWRNEGQPALVVKDSPPDLYELQLETPPVIVP